MPDVVISRADSWIVTPSVIRLQVNSTCAGHSEKRAKHKALARVPEGTSKLKKYDQVAVLTLSLSQETLYRKAALRQKSSH